MIDNWEWPQWVAAVWLIFWMHSDVKKFARKKLQENPQRPLGSLLLGAWIGCAILFSPLLLALYFGGFWK